MTTDTTTKHTPGPFFRIQYEGEIDEGAGEEMACGCAFTYETDHDSFRYDQCPTHAAAPALYDALEAMTDRMERILENDLCDCGPDGHICGKPDGEREVLEARAALKAARGEG